MIEHREGKQEESYYKENLRPNIAAFDTCLVEMCDCFIFFLKNKEGFFCCNQLLLCHTNVEILLLGRIPF